MTSQQIREAVQTYLDNHNGEIEDTFRALIEMEIEDECLARRITSREADELFALVA